MKYFQLFYFQKIMQVILSFTAYYSQFGKKETNVYTTISRVAKNFRKLL